MRPHEPVCRAVPQRTHPPADVRGRKEARESGARSSNDCAKLISACGGKLEAAELDQPSGRFGPRPANRAVDADLGALGLP